MNSGNTAYFVTYGSYNFNYSARFKSNFKLGFEKEFPKKLNFIGLDISGGHNFDSSSARFPKFLPKKVYKFLIETESSIGFKVFFNESISNSENTAKVSGFLININLVGIDLINKMKEIDLIPFVGFEEGRTGVRFTEEKSFNSISSGCIGFDLRFCLDNLAINFRTKYSLDLSKKMWSETNDLLLNTAFSGLVFSIGIGIHESRL